MGERVDLDAVEGRLRAAKAERAPATALVAIDKLVLEDAPALVAELRELREQRDDLARRLADMAIRYANLRADQAGEP